MEKLALSNHSLLDELARFMYEVEIRNTWRQFNVHDDYIVQVRRVGDTRWSTLTSVDFWQGSLICDLRDTTQPGDSKIASVAAYSVDESKMKRGEVYQRDIEIIAYVKTEVYRRMGIKRE